MKANTHRKPLTLSTKDIRTIWAFYNQGQSPRQTRAMFKRFLEKNKLQRGDKDNRLAQVSEVVYQICSFGYVKSRFARRDLTIGAVDSGGTILGRKTMHYGDEDEYGQFGKIPSYWEYPGDNETIRDYLDRK